MMIDNKLIENETQLEQHINQEMDKIIKHFERELASIRTGRAHPSMVENLQITCYGGTAEMPLKNLSAISIPEAQLIVIQPWDKSIMAEIEKAILQSDLGITPANDGNIIRLQLPEMSGSRREEMVKILHKKAEEARIGVRNIRKDFHNFVRDAERNKKISEDTLKRLSDKLQKITDKHIENIEKYTNKKEEGLKPQ